MKREKTAVRRSFLCTRFVVDLRQSQTRTRCRRQPQPSQMR